MGIAYAEMNEKQRAQSVQAVKRWRDANRAAFNSQSSASIKLRRSLAYATAWPAIVEHYGNNCLCCGVTSGLCFDHVKPLSAGGANSLKNGQPLCRKCNTFKGGCPTPSKDYRPDRGAWIADLVALNPWLGEPLPRGRWHLRAGGRERLRRLKALSAKPLTLPEVV